VLQRDARGGRNEGGGKYGLSEGGPALMHTDVAAIRQQQHSEALVTRFSNFSCVQKKLQKPQQVGILASDCTHLHSNPTIFTLKKKPLRVIEKRMRSPFFWNS
jgi:hypothetical protein